MRGSFRTAGPDYRDVIQYESHFVGLPIIWSKIAQAEGKAGRMTTARNRRRFAECNQGVAASLAVRL